MFRTTHPRIANTEMTKSCRHVITHCIASALAVAFTAFIVAGCGAEVAGGAAAVGAMQAAQLKQAQAQQTQVLKGFGAAQEAGAARAASAAD